MTLDELNIAIAEKCGYKRRIGSEVFWEHPDNNHLVYFDELPKYTADLNAANGAELVMLRQFGRLSSEWFNHCDRLCYLCGDDKMNALNSEQYLVTATALQRSAALGITWKLITQNQADKLIKEDANTLAAITDLAKEGAK